VILFERSDRIGGRTSQILRQDFNHVPARYSLWEASIPASMRS
jgi:hypothetical protein